MFPLLSHTKTKNSINNPETSEFEKHLYKGYLTNLLKLGVIYM